MNEKKKMGIVLVGLALVILLIVGLAVMNYLKSKKMYEQFEQTFYGNEKALVYIGRTSCGWCNLLNPTMEEMHDRYNLNYLHINIDEMNNTHFNKIVDTLQVSKLGTPYLVVVENGKVVDTQPEYADYDKLFAFLQKNDLIDKDAQLALNYIGLEDYQKLLKDTNKNIIVVGKMDCPYCVQAKLILNQVVDETKAKINYLSITSFETDADKKKAFEESLDYFSQTNWGTPVMLVVQDGKLVKVLEGLNSKDSYISFLKNQGVI